jgi:N-acetyl-anhydromuramyl-L-alanine amidase AmpD
MIVGAMTQPILQRPSPNHNSRGGQAVDILLLHYTGMQSAEAALSRLLDPEAAVSAHYVIDGPSASSWSTRVTSSATGPSRRRR